MSLFFEPIGFNDFSQRLSEAGNDCGEFSYRRLFNYVQKDIKVKFDLENISDDRSDGGLIGFRALSNGLFFKGVLAGGDWEQPIFTIFYWDGKQIRAYIPTKGNPYNTKTKMAYGNGDDEDCEVETEQDWDLIREDILERIQLKPKVVKEDTIASLRKEIDDLKKIVASLEDPHRPYS